MYFEKNSRKSSKYYFFNFKLFASIFLKKIYTYILNKQQINQLQQLNSHIICVYYEPGNLIWYLKKYISRFKEEKKLIELCNKNCGNYHLKNKTYNNTQIIVTRNSLKKRRSKNNTPLKNKTFVCMCGKNNCYIQKFLKSIYIYTLHICTYILCLWYIKICQTKRIAPTSRGGLYNIIISRSI